MAKIILIVFAIMFSPCLLRFLPDPQRKHKAEHEELRQEQNRLSERQDHIEQEQETIRQEQRKQAEQISKLEFQIEQLTADIETDRIRAGRLYALLDIAEANQAAAVPGSRTDEAAQRKIVTLENQISAAERRIRAAEFTLAQCKAKLAA